jgi:Outer membrane protein beta-barrel domain
MRIATIVAMIAGVLSALPAPAAAQDRPVSINFGGGPTFVLGDVGEGFTTGWGPAVGVTFNITPMLGAQFEYAYRYFWLKDDLDALGGLLDANHSTHQLDFNVVGTLTPPEKPIRVYAIGGPGMYYRSIEITRYEGTGVICDPWWYICGSYPIESILGSVGGWDFGINFGAGVGFKFEGGEFYVESRYHYTWGPELATSLTDPTLRKRNGQYWPLTFGLRF